MGKSGKPFSFAWVRRSLNEVLIDRKLASLGDSYVNFVYSLVVSDRKGEPLGVKVKGGMLAEALRKAGLRQYLPSRMSRHALADAAESLMVYAWLSNCITVGESITVMEKEKDPVEGLSRLLSVAKDRVTFP